MSKDKINIELNITDVGEEKGTSRGAESNFSNSSRNLFYASVAGSIGLRTFQTTKIDKIAPQEPGTKETVLEPFSTSVGHSSAVTYSQELIQPTLKKTPPGPKLVLSPSKVHKQKLFSFMSSPGPVKSPETKVQSGEIVTIDDEPEAEAFQLRGQKKARTKDLFSGTAKAVRKPVTGYDPEHIKFLADQLLGEYREGSGIRLGMFAGGITWPRINIQTANPMTIAQRWDKFKSSKLGKVLGTDVAERYSGVRYVSLSHNLIKGSGAFMKRYRAPVTFAAAGIADMELISRAIPLLTGTAGGLGADWSLLRQMGDQLGQALSLLTSSISGISETVQMTTARTKLGMNADIYKDFTVAQGVAVQKQEAQRRIDGDITQLVVERLINQIRGE